MQFTKESILKIAMTQSAVDAGCKPEDFLRQENVIGAGSEASPAARKYLELPFACNLISYGSNIVASVSDDCREAVEAYLLRTPIAHCFETPVSTCLTRRLPERGFKPALWRSIFFPTRKSSVRFPVRICSASLQSRTSPRCTGGSGATPCAKNGRSWICSLWAPLTGKS